MIATFALALLLATASQSPPAPDAAQAPPRQSVVLQKQLQEIYTEATKDMPKGEQPTPEQMAQMQTRFEELATKALEGVDFSTLEPDAIEAATELCRMAKGTKMKELSTALAARSKSPDADGFAFAVAAAGAIPWGAPGTPEATAQTRAAVAALAHPGLNSGFKGRTGSTLLGMLGEASDAELQAHAAELKSLSSVFKPDAPSETFGLCTEWVKLMQRAAPGAEAARVSILAAISERQANTTDERRLKSLKNMTALLDGAAMRGKLVGYEVPAMEFLWVSRVDGAPTWKTLADLKGKVVVLDFWTTWCGPCVASFPEVREMRAKYSPEDLEIVGITSPQGSVSHRKRERVECKDDLTKEQQELALYMQDMEMTWTVAMTKQDVFNPDFAVRGIPFVAIVGADGKVARVNLHPSNKDEIQKTVDELIAKKKAGTTR